MIKGMLHRELIIRVSLLQENNEKMNYVNKEETIEE